MEQQQQESSGVKKNYNPLAGSEIKELIIRRVVTQFEEQLRAVLADDPNLTEALSFPKAVLQFRLRYDVHQWPQEENRHKVGEVYKEIRLDELPPDITRILAGLPVPTAVRKKGAGLDGEELVVDEGRDVGEETKALVEEAFGRKAAGLETDLGSGVMSLPLETVDELAPPPPQTATGSQVDGGPHDYQPGSPSLPGASAVKTVAPGAEDKTSLLRPAVTLPPPKTPKDLPRNPVPRPKGGA